MASELITVVTAGTAELTHNFKPGRNDVKLTVIGIVLKNFTAPYSVHLTVPDAIRERANREPSIIPRLNPGESINTVISLKDLLALRLEIDNIKIEASVSEYLLRIVTATRGRRPSIREARTKRRGFIASPGNRLARHKRLGHAPALLHASADRGDGAHGRGERSCRRETLVAAKYHARRRAHHRTRE